jgi:shikimate kinase
VDVRDRGSAFVLTVLVGLALTAGITLALMPVLDSLVDRQRARSAADAAALAGVSGGRPAAAAIAEANGAALVAWSQTGDEVLVTVMVGGQRVAARATDAP